MCAISEDSQNGIHDQLWTVAFDDLTGVLPAEHVRQIRTLHVRNKQHKFGQWTQTLSGTQTPAAQNQRLLFFGSQAVSP